MFSRSHFFIVREIEQFRVDNPWGISLEQVNSNSVFQWLAKVHGLKDTRWQEGIFRVYIKFDENYNIRPPKVSFHTIPFHPNIDMLTGHPCVHFLDDWTEWKSSYTLTHILLTLQSLLSNPNLQDAVNSEALSMITNSPTNYIEMIDDCVLASQRVEAGLHPSQSEPRPCVKTPSPQKQVSMISFDSYHKQWVDLATSSPIVLSSQQFSEKGQKLTDMYAGTAKFSMGQEQAKLQNRAILYGVKNGNKNQNNTKEEKLARINHMRQTYLPPTRPLLTPEVPRITPIDLYDPCEQEVDELMAWTKSLPPEFSDDQLLVAR